MSKNLEHARSPGVELNGVDGPHRSGRPILVVDDDLDTLELISFNLIDAGFQVNIAVNGSEALHKARAAATPPALILLDVNLPDVEGFEVCMKLRADPHTRDIPIIFLTARDNEEDRIRGFELGANDYITKPFSPRELLLRVRNLTSFRLNGDQDTHRLRLGDLCIDTAGHSVTVGGNPVCLTLTEFRLLTTLALQNGRVQSRERLLEEVWAGDKTVDPRTVDTHMARLRDKLGKASSLVDTVYGMGYRFVKG